MSKIEQIMEYLNELIPNPKGELLYQTDYELLIAVVLSAQTTDKRVNEVTKVLFETYPNLESIANATVDDIKEYIKSVGMYQKKAVFVRDIAASLLEQYQGKVPSTREALESLPGVGRKTANVVLSILYDEPAIAVDTHVERVSKRLGLANNKDTVRKVEEKLYRIIPKDKLLQMHHQLLLFGRYHCKAIKPECEHCKLTEICNYKKRTND